VYIYWKDKNGKIFSISSVSNYKLTPTDYTEKNIYYMQNDEITGQGVNYDFSGESGSSPVKVANGRIEFKLPLFNEPFVVFEGNKFTATRQGEFIDYWEKVQ